MRNGQLVEYIVKHGPVSARDIADHFGEPATSIPRYLLRARGYGLVSRTKSYDGPWMYEATRRGMEYVEYVRK